MSTVILRPTGPGDLTEWAPSAGPAWAAVAAADALFISAAAAGLRERVTFEALPADVTAVASVTPHGALGSELGDPLARFSLRLAGVEEAGAPFVVPEGAYGAQSTLFATAPGGLAWTVARVNALQAGPDTVDAPAVSVAADVLYLVVDCTRGAAIQHEHRPVAAPARRLAVPAGPTPAD
jgi:hypothetical protein